MLSPRFAALQLSPFGFLRGCGRLGQHRRGQIEKQAATMNDAMPIGNPSRNQSVLPASKVFIEKVRCLSFGVPSRPAILASSR
jgi:hypothetical protein